MTSDRDFKRLIRAKAAETGASYSATRRRLLSRGVAVSPPTKTAALAGSRLTAEEAAALEARVTQDHADAHARARLLGYYLAKSGAESRRQGSQHALWFVQNDPTGDLADYYPLDSVLDGNAYDAARAAWLAHIQDAPDDPVLLRNAARCLESADRALALVLLERVVELHPESARARLDLAHAYTLGTGWPSPEAERALRVLGNPPSREDEELRALWLRRSAWLAVQCDELQVAEQCSTELLELALGRAGWDVGNRIHHGNLILGHVALGRRDVELSERRLVDAGATSGSPQLNSFGPNTSLARELLRHGRAPVVISFLQACRSFWCPPERVDPVAIRNRARLDSWVATIQEGGIPAFAANDLYGT